MDTKKIQNMIRFISESNVNEVTIETEDLKITVKNQSINNGDITQVIANPNLPIQSDLVRDNIQTQKNEDLSQNKSNPDTITENNNQIVVKSPMIGTMYRKPAPDKPVFCNVGDIVKAGDTLCIIEAMKLFNEVESEVSGKIVKIITDDATPVEFDQPLLIIEPC